MIVFPELHIAVPGFFFRNIEISKSRNVEMSKSRNVEISKCRHLEIPKYRNLEISKYRHLDISTSRNLAPIPRNIKKPSTMNHFIIKTRLTRAALTLALMLLSATTAWAFKTETPVTYIVSRNGSTITISGGGESHSCNASSSMGNSYTWDANVSCNLSNDMSVKPNAEPRIRSNSS